MEKSLETINIQVLAGFMADLNMFSSNEEAVLIMLSKHGKDAYMPTDEECEKYPTVADFMLSLIGCR